MKYFSYNNIGFWGKGDDGQISRCPGIFVQDCRLSQACLGGGATGGSAPFLKFSIIFLWGLRSTFEKSIVVSPLIIWPDHHHKGSTLSNDRFSQFVFHQIISSLTKFLSGTGNYKNEVV